MKIFALFMVFCILPSWSQDNAFTFEVFNTTRFNSINEGEHLDARLKIGVALDLKLQDTDLNKLPITAHQLPIPEAYPRSSKSQIVKMGKGGPVRRLSLIMYGDSDVLQNNCLGCCCFGTVDQQKPIYSISTILLQRVLQGSTVCVDFKGFKDGAPLLDVIIFIEDDLEQASRMDSWRIMHKRLLKNACDVAEKLGQRTSKGFYRLLSVREQKPKDSW